MERRSGQKANDQRLPRPIRLGCQERRPFPFERICRLFGLSTAHRSFFKLTSRFKNFEPPWFQHTSTSLSSFLLVPVTLLFLFADHDVPEQLHDRHDQPVAAHCPIGIALSLALET